MADADADAVRAINARNEPVDVRLTLIPSKAPYQQQETSIRTHSNSS